MKNLIEVDGLLRIPDNKYGDKNVVYPFKGRTIDIDKPIYVYRNLNRKGKWYSIKQDGVVVAHSTAICIRSVECVIMKSGKEKAIKTQQRNVHAYLKGMYDTSGMGTTADRNDLPCVFKYNPFSELGFYNDTMTSRTFEILGARFVIVNHEGVKGSYVNSK
jgi:hypothetical protein